jgi:hypothetical protein
MPHPQEHEDAVPPEHRFSPVAFRGEVWDLSHLDSFVLKESVDEHDDVPVVVLFSCHCFTRGVEEFDRSVVPVEEFYSDTFERRVLDAERYRLSRLFLPQLVRDLHARHIQIGKRANFFTAELTNSFGQPVHYVVFFEVTKDKRRRRRLLLRVQSAYPITTLDKRTREARKVRFPVLLRAAFSGRQIKG